MAHNYIVCVDAEEYNNDGKGPDATMIRYVYEENKVSRAIQEITRNWPNSTICVYKLTGMQRIKEQPKYAMYSVTKDGEILPV